MRRLPKSLNWGGLTRQTILPKWRRYCNERRNILFDPVQSIAKHYNWIHDHDGGTNLITGIADPLSAHILAAHPQRPPGFTPRTPNFSLEMEALIKAIRDFEVLVTTFSLAGGMIVTYNAH